MTDERMKAARRARLDARPAVAPTLTRLELTGVAESIVDGAKLPPHVSLLVVVTDVRSGQQGEGRKTPVRE